MFEIIVQDKKDNIIDRLSCNWLLLYNDKPNIDYLLEYCENKIQEYSYRIYLIENTNIDEIKKTIMNQIDKIDNLSDLIEYLKKKGDRLNQDFYDVHWSDQELLESEIIRFEKLKEFLMKYKYSENILEYSN